MPRHKEVSDAQIVAAARSIFLEHGVQAPVAIVAERLGVSPATLFVRMGSKRRLIEAALWPPDPSVLATLARGPLDNLPLERQLCDIAFEIAQYTQDEIPATFTLYAAGLRAKPGEDYSDVTPARLRRGLTRWLELAGPTGSLACSPHTAAELIIGTLEARAMHAFIGRRPESTRATRVFVRTLVAAIFEDPDAAEID